MIEKEIPQKSNTVLNWILIAFILVVIRVWYLATMQHEHHLSLARQPQRKTVTESAERGTIRDRFNQPLAINKVHYKASIRFDELRFIPSVRFKKDAKGKKQKVFARKKYIMRLAKFLGQRLQMDPIYIEDIIYSKASIFPNTPFVIKEGLSEKEYYSLRMLEKDWPGLETQISYKRSYPEGKSSSHLIGYMGSINERRFLSIAEEISTLQKYLIDREDGLPAILPKGYASADEIHTRFKHLQEKSYRLSDIVGRTGIEKVFDEQLRGERGIKHFEIDIKGRQKRALPGSVDPIPGKRVLLSISSELQAFAEELLIENETLRDVNFSTAGKEHGAYSSPWIKGGSIIAMIPKTGEIVAMASYPRFDPNDFILTCPQEELQRKQIDILRWLENEQYIAQIWNGIRPLEKEIFKEKKIVEHKRFLSWDLFLDSVLSLKGASRKAFSKIQTVEKVLFLQNAFETLLTLSKQSKMAFLIDTLFPEEEGHIPSRSQLPSDTKETIKSALEEYKDFANEILSDIAPYLSNIPYNDDKLLVLDLTRICIDNKQIPEDLVQIIGSETLSFYRKQNQAFSCVESHVKKILENIFYQNDFANWREKHFKEFLREKRKEEKNAGRYQKPYLDYLQEKRRELFNVFWRAHRIPLIESYLLKKIDDTPSQLACTFHKLCSEVEQTVISGEPNVFDGKVSKPFRKNTLRPDGITEDSVHPEGCEKCRLKLYFQAMQNEETSSNVLKEYIASLPPHLVRKYLSSMRCFSDLNRSLWGKYRFHKATGPIQLEKHLAGAFYPPSGFGHCKSYNFEETAPLGSIFKIVTSYEALRQHYLKAATDQIPNDQLNPLTIFDETRPHEMTKKGIVLGSTLDGQPITRIYKGGRLPKSYRSIGRIDFLDAMEQSSNLYFSLLAGEVLDHPTDLTDAASALGFGKRSGFIIPGEVSGNLPNDIRDNRTGLYAFAIGQHSLTATPLQTVLMLSTFANGGNVMKPQIVHLLAGMERSFPSKNLSTCISHKLCSKFGQNVFSDEPNVFDEKVYKPFQENTLSSDGRTDVQNHPEIYENCGLNAYTYQEMLSDVGIYFPLFHKLQPTSQSSQITPMHAEIKKQLFLPPEIRNYLLESLGRVTSGARGAAHAMRIRYLYGKPKLMREYLSLQSQMVGKTSSAEINYRPTLDRESKPILCTHIWFGGIAFNPPETSEIIEPEKKWEDPELAVVVFLRYGDYGKEAAPLAAQIISKWHEINSRIEK